LVKKYNAPDWSPLERSIKNIIQSFSYDFVKEHYNHNMREAEEYVGNVLKDPKYEKYAQSLAESFRKLGSVGVADYADLLNKIRSKEERMRILEKTGMKPENLVSTLNYIYNWVLPRAHYLTQFIDNGNEAHKRYIMDLRLDTILIFWNMAGLKRGERISQSVQESLRPLSLR